METGTQLTVQQRASVALGAAEHEKKLLELVAHAQGVTAITNAVTYQECHGARMGLKNARIAIEKAGKAAREDATAYSKGVIAEEKRLIGIGAAEETRLETIQTEHDTKVEREKAAKIEAERQRVERIQAAIEEIRGLDRGLTIVSGSAVIAAHLIQLRAEAIDERFAEFKEAAEQAKVSTITKLTDLHNGALEYEELQRRAKADREEAARLKADEDKRQREAAEREAAEIRARAEADAKRRAEIAAEERAATERIAAQERAAQAERDKADREARERLAAQEAEAKAIRDAEDKRLQAERDRLAAEARALEDRQRAEREALEAKERAEREAQEKIERAARQKAEKERLAAELKARQEQEAREAEQRETKRKADELLSARDMLVTFRHRYGEIPEFAGVAKAIDAYMTRANKQRAAA